jgi:hypothetical protein
VICRPSFVLNASCAGWVICLDEGKRGNTRGRGRESVSKRVKRAKMINHRKGRRRKSRQTKKKRNLTEGNLSGPPNNPKLRICSLCLRPSTYANTTLSLNSLRERERGKETDKSKDRWGHFKMSRNETHQQQQE